MPDDGSGIPSADLLLFAASPLESARKFIRCRYMHRGTRTLHHQSGTFYGWQMSHYVELAAEEMRADLYDFLDRAKTHKPDEEDELVPFNPNRSKVANVAEALAAAAQLGQTLIPPAWLDGTTKPPPGEVIACRNGLLHLPTRRLLAHTPNFFSLNALGFDFNPKAAAPANWLSFLRSIWPDDVEAISTLQELFGLCLTNDTRHQKAFLIVGPKRSGKGTIARVLTELLGQANVCGPTLSSIGSQFGLEPLIGRPLAIISDARLSGKADQQVIVERLLSITGEDGLTIDRKNRVMWTGRLSTRFVILTNELPRLSDNSGALAGRLVMLTMNRSFYGKEDLGLGARLTPELPGILLWAIEGWERLRKRGHFVPPRSSAAAQQELEDLGSPISAFLRERCKVAVGAEVPCKALYTQWCGWCKQQGRDRAGNLQTFGRDLAAAVPGLRTERPRAEAGAARPRYYVGIGKGDEWDGQLEG